MKSDVEKSLPPKREIKLLIGMTEMQRQWYGNILTKNLDVINAMGGSRGQVRVGFLTRTLTLTLNLSLTLTLNLTLTLTDAQYPHAPAQVR